MGNRLAVGLLPLKQHRVGSNPTSPTTPETVTDASAALEVRALLRRPRGDGPRKEQPIGEVSRLEHGEAGQPPTCRSESCLLLQESSPSVQQATLKVVDGNASGGSTPSLSASRLSIEAMRSLGKGDTGSPILPGGSREVRSVV